MKATLSALGICGALLAACGGSREPADSPADAAEPASEGEASASAEPRSTDADGASGSAETSEQGGSKDAASAPEPAFTEGMSVDEAIKAVPSDIERRNIDQETLGKPLADVSLYEPCKPGSARVKLRVAIWDGKAVGIDVTTTPKNDKLTACIKERVREVTWEKKVKSLNTIEYQF